MSTEFTTQFAIRMPDGQMLTNPFTGFVATFSDRALAEQAWQHLRAQAASVGVSEWAGVIVHRYCTPFLGPQDPAEHLVNELTTWLQQQGGHA